MEKHPACRAPVACCHINGCPRPRRASKNPLILLPHIAHTLLHWPLLSPSTAKKRQGRNPELALLATSSVSRGGGNKMISLHDLYTVLAAVVPLYVAMILAYGSVRWWGIFTPDQCSGINRFVAIFAVPLLSFHFISTNNPYDMNLRFLAADTLQKLLVLAGLAVWSRLPSRAGAPRLDWSITLFSLSTLPNTLVMGIPLLIAMYGPYSGSLMVQIVVLQCIIWYTLLLLLFEFRAARMLIADQFPDTAASIVSLHVDPDVVSLEGGRTETEAVAADGRLHVTVRRSSASRRSLLVTPRPSNLTGAEIYSLSSSRNPTPRGSNFSHADFFAMVGGAPPPPTPAGVRGSSFGASELYSLQSSRGPTPRQSNFDEHSARPKPAATTAAHNHDAKELHMFVWSSSASPVSEVSGLPVFSGGAGGSPLDVGAKEIRMIVPADLPQNGSGKENEEYGAVAIGGGEDFSFGGGKTVEDAEAVEAGPDGLTKLGSSSTAELHPKDVDGANTGGGGGADARRARQHKMPPASVMTRLILIMVWRKLIRNPNTYSSLIGLTWSLVAFRSAASSARIGGCLAGANTSLDYVGYIGKGGTETVRRTSCVPVGNHRKAAFSGSPNGGGGLTSFPPAGPPRAPIANCEFWTLLDL